MIPHSEGSPTSGSGEPLELSLFFFGRRDHALVDLTGDAEGVAEVRSAPIGF